MTEKRRVEREQKGHNGHRKRWKNPLREIMMQYRRKNQMISGQVSCLTLDPDPKTTHLPHSQVPHTR